MALVDCYSELFAFTGYLLRDLNQKPVSYETAEKNYSLLIGRAEERARSSGYSEEDWLAGLFPVCAWIDESILCSAWPEKTKWERAQLQRRYFQTTNAGVEVFTRLADLGEEVREVREVYAYCLAMGFQGTYYQASDGQLQEIAFQNLRNLPEESAPDFPQELFPDAYEAALAGRREKKKKWRSPSIFFIVVLVLPVILFFGLYFSYDFMLSNEIAGYLGLDVVPLYRTPLLKKESPSPAEQLVVLPSDVKKAGVQGDTAPQGKPARGDKAGRQPQPGHYRVKAGDTLSSIAGQQEVYGDPLMWPILYRYNLKEMAALKEGADLPVAPLPQGIDLLTATPHQIQENKKKRSEDQWVIYVLNTTTNDKAVRAAVSLVKAGHVVYLTSTKSKGKERTWVRVGFFNSRAEADEQAKRIKKFLSLPKIRTAKLSKDDFERYAGY